MAVQKLVIPPAWVPPPFAAAPVVTPAGEPVNDPERSERTYFGGKNPNAPLTYEPLPYMNDYLDELRNGDPPRSPDYVRMVRVGLLHFANHARGTEGIRHPNEITRQHLLNFQAYLAEAKSPSSGQPYRVQYRQQLMRYLRGWIHWLVEVEHIDEDPWRRIRVGQTRKQPKPLRVDELADLFEAHRRAAFTIGPFAWHRRGVILALLLGWGLRIHELQSLNVAQVQNRQIQWVKVRNKGGGTKTLPYGPAMQDEVHRWLPQRASKAVPGEDALVIDQTGGRLSIARIREIVTELGEKAGVKINPHQLRDTMATTMVNGDVPLERVQAITGHRDVGMLLAYAQIGDANVKQEHDRVMNPILDFLLTGRRPAGEQAS